jgi:hypothetical protein
MLTLRQDRRRADRDAYVASLERERLALATERDAFALIEKQFLLMLDDFEIAYPDSVLN